jgi:hypothetical protein
LIRLEQGSFFVLYWGEWSKQLKLEIPAASEPSGFLDAFFREVPLPRGRILWRRQGVRLPRHMAAKTVSAGARRTTASKAKRPAVKKTTKPGR